MIVVLDGRRRMARRMKLEDAVSGGVPVDDDVGVTGFFRLVHVLGRRDREKAQRGSQCGGERPGQPHVTIVRDSLKLCQLMHALVALAMHPKCP